MTFPEKPDKHRLAHLFPLGLGRSPVTSADAEMAEMMALQGVLPKDLLELVNEFPNMAEESFAPEAKEPDPEKLGSTVVDLFTRERI